MGLPVLLGEEGGGADRAEMEEKKNTRKSG
jgi:hypothetical protein